MNKDYLKLKETTETLREVEYYLTGYKVLLQAEHDPTDIPVGHNLIKLRLIIEEYEEQLFTLKHILEEY